MTRRRTTSWSSPQWSCVTVAAAHTALADAEAAARLTVRLVNEGIIPQVLSEALAAQACHAAATDAEFARWAWKRPIAERFATPAEQKRGATHVVLVHGHRCREGADDVSTSRNTDHVVIVDCLDGNDMKCLRCGARESFLRPAEGQSLTVAAAMGDAFAKAHARCKGPIIQSPEPKVAEAWAKGDDTGVSSATIWSVMMGRRLGRYADSLGNPPRDPADFGRCHRLLAAFPDWRPRLPEVAARHPRWAPLVGQWDALAALYEEELPSGVAPKLYDRMKQLLGRDP